MFEGNRIDSCMVSESPIDIFVDNHVASTMVAKNFVQSSPTNKIAINDFLQNGLTCQPCKIDDVMETTKVLRSIDKMLSRIPLEDLTLPRVPVNKFSATSSLSFQGIAQHLVSLRTGYIARLARPIVQKLMLHPKNANIFNAPVDPIALDIPSYFQVIKSPMDLGTIKSRLQCGHYSSINQCFEDVRLVFSNAMTFNVPDHYVHRVAKELLVEFEEEVKSLEEKCARDMERKSNHKCGLCSGSLCVLCGEKCLKFETPTLFCHAATCGQRIKKHSVFFISPDGTLIWCQKCYVNLPSVLNEGMEGVPALPKRSLLKRRFDEEIAEPWVECDKCGSWCHQLCALYTDVGTKNSTLFNCPMCILNSGKMPAVVSPLSSVSIGDYPSSPTGKACLEEADMDLPIEMADAGKNFTAVSNFAPNVWRAESLPRTHLSDFLEAAVKDLLVQLGQEDIVDTICIRMTSNYDNLFEVPNSIRENFQTSDGTTVSSHMAFRQKCIQLFQTIDGVDVCLFCLYVHEFDASCPPPNQSSVYIAYLDSVDYFRPSHVRTFVYQEIVVAYLKWAQVRGFKQCHLWSCPPQRGDNFIFWCHPSHQRTPSRDRLNSWYHAILHRSECLKISKGVDKFWNLYFSGYQVNRREEGPCRQAAKNSFVGTGKVSNNKGKGLPPLPSKAKLEGTKSVQQQSGAVGPLVCPPLFDGDYWMLEFVRLHAALMNKDPMAGGPQSLAHYRWCKDQIKNLYSKPIAAAFRQPVDPVALNIPRYPQVIKNPMDLGTIREKLRLSQYGTILSFVEDIRLTFKNAMLFNPEGHAIHIYARQLLAEFEKLLAEYVGTWLASFFPVEFTQDQILEQCKLGSPPSSDGSSSIRSRAASIASLTTLDTGVTSGCLPWAEDVDGQSKSTSAKQVKIVVDGDDCDQMISSRKRTLSRTISDDLSFLVDDYENDSRGGIDASSTVSLSSFSRKMRRGSMDSLSTAADLEDTFEILAEENMIEDYSGRASLGTLRASQSLMNNYLNYSFSARDFNNSLVTDKFSGPVLAQRALFSLVSDLSKAVNRMSDDLFVVKFVSCHDQQDGASHAHVETKPTEKVNDSKKRGRHPANLAQQHLKAEFSAECMEMLSHLSSDTSDPDPVIRSPLVDSRYTFLETCQFRHYQFDSLRRAKYSSLMMLFHLHNPYDRSCRPLCKYCGETICGIRWHCDQCANFDVCDPCKVARDSSPSSLGKPVKLVESHSDLEDAVSCGGCHVHPLTPYRVTFH